MFAFVSVLLTLSVFISHVLLEFGVFSIVFWTLAFLSQLLYLKTSLTNPGFVQLAPVPNESTAKQLPPVTYNALNEEVSRNDAEDKTVEQEGPVIALKKDTLRSADRSHRDGDVQITEKKICIVCNFEQALRVKHCKDCGHCVQLHDHHCPWLGTCVGLRNRRWFFWYLVVQAAVLWLGLIAVRFRQVALSLEDFGSPEEIVKDILRGILLTVLALFTLMVTCLLVFHSFLALKNLTTWEFLSWQRISYLKQFERRHGSPFSVGLHKNLQQYCCLSQQDWVLPSA